MKLASTHHDHAGGKPTSPVICNLQPPARVCLYDAQGATPTRLLYPSLHAITRLAYFPRSVLLFAVGEEMDARGAGLNTETAPKQNNRLSLLSVALPLLDTQYSR